MSKVVIVPDLEALSEEAARRFVRLAREADAARRRFSVALSGGSTPLGLYRRLAAGPARHEVPWRHVHLFWGDERSVLPTHPESNFGQVYQALIRHVPIPTGHVHPIRGDLDPEAAADVYAAELEAFFGHGRPEFDLVLLGMGDDGHVAALFPGSEVLQETARPVAASTGDYRDRPARRVTLTLPAINAARHVMILVSGKAKAATVRAVLEGPPASLPAQQIRPSSGALTWILDEAAANELKRTP